MVAEKTGLAHKSGTHQRDRMWSGHLVSGGQGMRIGMRCAGELEMPVVLLGVCIEIIARVAVRLARVL